MTVVFVHGNPEVASIWDELVAVLDRDDVVALSPPGFGAAVPAGFGSTAPEYARWLTDELGSLAPPIHLVGHDWGGIHVVNSILLDPGRCASVTTDVAGCMAAGYEWHDLARIWRTPDAGEELVAAMAGAPVDDRVARFVDLGMTPAAARACAEHVGEMSASILALYRSADETTLRSTGTAVSQLRHRPDLHVIVATDDHYTGGEDKALATAHEWGAVVHRLDGLGHWWMMQDPVRSAAVIRSIVGT